MRHASELQQRRENEESNYGTKSSLIAASLLEVKLYQDSWPKFPILIHVTDV